jgi:Mn2+/Fe2+ NRAMP family transporter
LPVKSLVQVMMISQTFNGVLLPVILIAMLRLINDKRQMGRFTNGRVFNALSWVIVAALIALTFILVVTSVFPNFLGNG